MRHASILKTLLAAACSLMIAGCAVYQSDINSAYDAVHHTADDAMANMPGSMALVEDVPTAFLGDRLVPWRRRRDERNWERERTTATGRRRLHASGQHELFHKQ